MTDTVLIFRIGSIGDTVVALPCFHRIARTFAAFRRILVTNVPVGHKAASVESVLGRGTLIDDVIYFPPPPRKLHHFFKLGTVVRETKAKILVYVADRGLCKSLRDACFFHACGIRQVIGAPLARDLRKLRIDPVTGYSEREAARLARCLTRLGPIDLEDPGMWDLHLQSDERYAADVALAELGGDDFIAVSMGTKLRVKDWGDPNWAALLRSLGSAWCDLALVFFGSADEFDRSSGLAACWPGRTLNLCGRLTPRESGAALQRALVFLGHDSGPMHLASAVGIPCVAIFGNHCPPKWWHPIGQQHRLIHNMRGIAAIAPAEVHDAAAEAICGALARQHQTVLKIAGIARDSGISAV